MGGNSVIGAALRVPFMAADMGGAVASSFTCSIWFTTTNSPMTWALLSPSGAERSQVLVTRSRSW